MKSDNYIRLELPSRSSNEAVARGVVAAFAAQLDPTLEELGEKSGRFNYEFACDLGKRIPRVFYKSGRRIASWTQFDGLIDVTV